MRDMHKIADVEFKKNLFTYSDKELILRLAKLGSISEVESIKGEMTRRSIMAIKEFNKSSSEQTKKVITLTKWIIGLTIAMLFAVLAQIGLVLFPYIT